MAKKIKHTESVLERLGRGHTDLREFVGRSWKDLDDLWPRKMRLSSEAWQVLGLALPAYSATLPFILHLTGGQMVSFRDLVLLCWLQRCEEARENVGITADLVLPGSGFKRVADLVTRQRVLRRCGLLEDLVGAPRTGLYRITASGKMILAAFVENLEQAHYDIAGWKAKQKPKTAKRIDYWLRTTAADWPNLKLRGRRKPLSSQSDTQTIK